jgi:hypothetical protein
MQIALEAIECFEIEEIAGSTTECQLKLRNGEWLLWIAYKVAV